MKNDEIAIFSVSKTITQRISNVLIERKIDIPVYEYHYFDVVKKAQQLIQHGTKIIISRGGTAALLRNNLNIPVIEIAHDLHGVYRILQEARKQSQKIAAVGFPQFCKLLRHYQNMTQDEFKICQVYNHYDIENVIKNLADKEYQLVIGGLTVAEIAKKYNLQVVMGDTDNLSVEQALDLATSLLKYIRNEEIKLAMCCSALNQSREGVICLDQSGEIISINARGIALFHCQAGEKIFQKDAFKEIFDYIINERDVKEHVLEIEGETVHLAVKHFSSKLGFYTILTGTRPGQVSWPLSRSVRKGDHKGFTTTYSFDDIIGCSPQIKSVIDQARIYAAHDLPVNIVGETGTGKELFAQSIHHASSRSAGPFVAVNCAAIPETLLESELFGYADGAFTNARRGGKPGVFEMAMNGTVFIDEISEAPLSVQIKLLRILQEKTFSRVGGETLINADFRLLTASNKDLSERVAAGEFRQDLWYRINVLELRLPALKDREGDAMLIIESLLARQAKALNFTDEAVDFLNRYLWPGNLRELQATVSRLIVHNVTRVNVAVLQSLCGLFPEASGPEKAMTSLEGESHLLKKQEQKLIASVLKQYDGDRVRAARILGISPTTLWRKMKRYGM
ncbi:sigma 54-interacting transcriptional regulator [Pantoea sp. KPR_PJ]|uniref:sigma 54-interacting transcriptional regulator n=1 Tax=Pantoea sp. KPR_PJ TaxID=2738375 RepID=UPI003528BA66